MIRWLLLLLAFSISACGNDASDEGAPQPAATEAAVQAQMESGPPSETYDEAHSRAVAAIEASAEKGHAWTTSDALLKEAEAAAADGDEPRAIQLADDARVQAELASYQADVEKTLWQDRVLTD